MLLLLLFLTFPLIWANNSLFSAADSLLPCFIIFGGIAPWFSLSSTPCTVAAINCWAKRRWEVVGIFVGGLFVIKLFVEGIALIGAQKVWARPSLHPNSPVDKLFVCGERRAVVANVEAEERVVVMEVFSPPPRKFF